jgi:hypothetical protein
MRRAELSPKELKTCFSILWVRKIFWHMGIFLLWGLRWTFICTTRSKYCSIVTLNNTIAILHAKLKRFTGKELRNIMMLRRLLWLSICDYNSTIVAHDTHQTSHISKLVFKRLSPRSRCPLSLYGGDHYWESINKDVYTWMSRGEFQCSIIYVTCVVLMLFETPCNINYPLLATKLNFFYSLIAGQSFRSLYLPATTEDQSLKSTCLLTGTSGSISYIYNIYWQADRQSWTALNETKHCSRCTDGVVCFVQNIWYM